MEADISHGFVVRILNQRWMDRIYVYFSHYVTTSVTINGSQFGNSLYLTRLALLLRKTRWPMLSSQRDESKREQSAVGESLDLSMLRATYLVLIYQACWLVTSVIVDSLAVSMLSLLCLSDYCSCLMLTYLYELGKNLACILLVLYVLLSNSTLCSLWWTCG